jgi:hypothetical protein
MLDSYSRAAIVALTALCAAGAFALAPIGARSSIEPTPPRLASIDMPIALEPSNPATITRDPFSEPLAHPAPTLAPAYTPTSAQIGTLGVAASAGPVGETLPSNLANDTIPAIPGTPDASVAGARVTAIVTGARPFAMIELGGVHQIKGIGDHIGGQTIVAISIDGVRLSNGDRLAVDAAAQL